MTGDGKDDVLLPILRPDLRLNEGPPEPEGTPTWTLYDPAANKYYKIGWLEFECLVRFKDTRSTAALAARIAKETPLAPDANTIAALVTFLIQSNLVLTTGAGVASHFETMREKLDKSWWQRALHGYLFFTIPLFKPQTLLNKTYPYVKPLLSKTFMQAMTLLLLYGFYLSFQRADEMATTFMSYLSIEGIALFLVTTLIVKIIHELGHAYVATKHGVPVTVIGVAFIVLYPVLYTETTNAWKLKSRKDRLYISAGGLMAEYALAAIALVLWHFLPPGMAQSLCFMVAIVSLVASLIINLNPLMRFDGYYLFSDFVGIDNLQDRSFAFARWKLRKVLWRFEDAPPEPADIPKQRFLCAFGFATWIYRFFLFMGIAIIVYHLFFQPLGLILALVEVIFFIGMPIWREVKVWLERLGDILASKRGKKVAFICGLLAISLFIPWQGSVSIPAVLHAENYIRFYPSVAAQIDEILVKNGQVVGKDDVLFRLSSDELDYNIKIVTRQLEDLRAIRKSSQATPDLARARVMIDSEIALAEKQIAGYMKIKEQLVITAPFQGKISNLDPTLRTGRWVNTSDLLALLIDDRDMMISGYVSEQDVARIAKDGTGVFYAEYSPLKKFTVTLKEIDQTSAREIFWPELGTQNKGPLATEKDAQGVIRPLPKFTLYPVRLGLIPGQDNPLNPDFIARGTVRLSAENQSIASGLIKKGISALRYEGNL